MAGQVVLVQNAGCCGQFEGSAEKIVRAIPAAFFRLHDDKVPQYFFRKSQQNVGNTLTSRRDGVSLPGFHVAFEIFDIGFLPVQAVDVDFLKGAAFPEAKREMVEPALFQIKGIARKNGRVSGNGPEPAGVERLGKVYGGAVAEHQRVNLRRFLQILRIGKRIDRKLLEVNVDQMGVIPRQVNAQIIISGAIAV